MDFSRTMMSGPASAGGFDDDFAGGIPGVKYEFPGDSSAAGAGSGLMLMDDYSGSLAGGVFAPTTRTVLPGYGLGMMTTSVPDFSGMGSMANPLMSLLQSAFPSSEMTSPSSSSEAPVMSDDSMDTAGAMHEEHFAGYGMSSDMKTSGMGLMPMAMPFEVLTSPMTAKPIPSYDPSLRSKSLTTDEHIVFPPEMYERLGDNSGTLSEPEVDVYTPDSTSLYSFDETGDGDESPEPGAMIGGRFDWSFVKDKSRRHRIMRWKEKKARILSGKSKSRTYYNRQKYAKIRPRVNGRFVSHEEWERMQADSSEMAGSSPAGMTETSFDMDVAAVEAAASTGLWKGVISGLEPME